MGKGPITVPTWEQKSLGEKVQLYRSPSSQQAREASTESGMRSEFELEQIAATGLYSEVVQILKSCYFPGD